MNIKDKSSKTLAAIVVSYRTIGFNKDIATQAMEELSKRKANGDEFNYQSFIANEIANQPERPALPNVMGGIQELFGFQQVFVNDKR
jgi:hypothetical protein